MPDLGAAFDAVAGAAARANQDATELEAAKKLEDDEQREAEDKRQQYEAHPTSETARQNYIEARAAAREAQGKVAQLEIQSGADLRALSQAIADYMDALYQTIFR